MNMLDGGGDRVSSSVVDAVQALSKLDATVFDLVGRQAADVLTKAYAARAVPGRDGERLYESDDKQVATMCMVLVKLAQESCTTPAAQRQVLQAWGVDDAAALTTRLAPICNDTLPLLTAILERTSFDFAHVVDVSWRLDYVLRSSTAGSVHEPLYFVDLTLQEPSGQFTKRAFTCTVEELRDLVYRLQEASNAIEKLAGR